MTESIDAGSSDSPNFRDCENLAHPAGCADPPWLAPARVGETITGRRFLPSDQIKIYEKLLTPESLQLEAANC